MQSLISGKYVTSIPKEHHGENGVSLKFENPDDKANTIPMDALREMHGALEEDGYHR